MAKFTVRNDFVLIRSVKLEEVRGLAMPDTAIEGKKFIVEAIGDKVENLKVGDSVLAVGNLGTTVFPLPNHKDLVVVRQEAVALIVNEEPR